MKTALTSLGIGTQANFQFFHSLRNVIHVYVFGDKIGEVALGGVCFPSLCGNPSAGAGLDYVLDFYNTWKISSYGRPLTIAVGAYHSFEGFLTGCRADVADPQSGLIQFSFRFHVLPDALKVTGTTGLPYEIIHDSPALVQQLDAPADLGGITIFGGNGDDEVLSDLPAFPGLLSGPLTPGHIELFEGLIQG
jgi:hypothetical protein